MDDSDPRSASQVSPARAGDDLARLSEAELTERIEIFRAETTRIEAELRQRTSVRAAAEALFGGKTS
ncbi:DUF1192 domain-containing protein [Pannonibacter tanglangensis]|uniref:DUF1192 family protein n=1 Tax=Pannonibacter tanglangensis TaxID=2750084 RepID=A0ABW9ZRB5_9HYPH|nr:DUF1192 domain-containing protein [Pannonibacter sp. XCT-34]NBN65265.1 DUF1192 family protein [Pannonibacter sp. XCT-34]